MMYGRIRVILVIRNINITLITLIFQYPTGYSLTQHSLLSFLLRPHHSLPSPILLLLLFLPNRWFRLDELALHLPREHGRHLLDRFLLDQDTPRRKSSVTLWLPSLQGILIDLQF